MRIQAEKAEAELLHLCRSFILNSDAVVGRVSRLENSDAKEVGGVEGPTDKRTASSFRHGKLSMIPFNCR
jgi:hypothetical protein